MIASPTLLADAFAPSGLYSVDTLFKVFSLWAAEEIYGWIFLYVLPFAVIISTVVRAYRGLAAGRGFVPALEYLFWIPFLYFFLWPVAPVIGGPTLQVPEKDRQAVEKAKKDLLDKERSYQGVPRILLWGMALADTFTSEATQKVFSLSSRELSQDDMLRLRLANATPTDDDLAQKSVLYWVLCYEPALWNFRARREKGPAENQEAPHPLHFVLDNYFPAYDEKEWMARIDNAPQGDLFDGTTDCRSLRQKLFEDYGEELQKDEHQELMQDLRQSNVSFTEEEYAGYLVRQAATANASFTTHMRSLVSGQIFDGQQHVDYLPVSDNDFFLYRWGAKAVNWIGNVFSDFSAAIGTRMEMPGMGKQAYETFKMLAPSLHGVAMLFVILVFPFVAISVMAGFVKPLLTYWKLYLTVALWPFLWALLGAYQNFFTERDWGSLTAFMSDAGTYTNVALPFMYMATPFMSGFIVYAAFGFAGSASKEPVGAAVGGKGMAGSSHRGEEKAAQATKDGAKGAWKGASEDAFSVGRAGFAAAGPIGGAAGAILGAGVGAVRGGLAGAAGSILGSKKDSDDQPHVMRGSWGKSAQDAVMGKSPGSADDEAGAGAKGQTGGSPPMPSQGSTTPESAASPGSASNQAASAGAGSGAAGGAAAVPPAL